MNAPLTLDAAQSAAVEKILRWYHYRDDRVFRLFGYAGTGKTTLAKVIADRIPGTVLFAAYTGKAVEVLRRKGCDALTIHRLIYRPIERSRRELDEMRREHDRNPDPGLWRQIQKLAKELGSPAFVLQDNSPLRDADLLIVDEVSMVDDRMARDLLSFGTKILVLGDPAQLPPVQKGTGWFVNAEPDVLLTEVHRTALESPILRMATDIRVKGTVPPVTSSGSLAEAFRHDQIICGRNKTRWAVNQYMKKSRRHLLDPGDPIMFLKNDRTLGVYNGQQAVVVGVRPHGRIQGAMQADVRFDDGLRSLPIWEDGFESLAGEDAAKRKPGPVAAATYAWAITCHKAQGSEWDSVFVIDESATFGDKQRNWLYTAATRASENLSVWRAS